MPTKLPRIAVVTAVAILGLTGCTNTSPEAKAYRACEKYVEAGEASNDNASEYCMETSDGSGETTPESIAAIRELIVKYNQRAAKADQIIVDF